MAESNVDLLNLRTAQQGQILEEYRSNIFHIELKINLVIKLLEEKGVLLKNEFDQRWPQYLRNDVGTVGPEGRMEGTLKVTMYEAK